MVTVESSASARLASSGDREASSINWVLCFTIISYLFIHRLIFI
jgi:hypothetical protein